MPKATPQRHLRAAWEDGTLPGVFVSLFQGEDDLEMLLMLYLRSYSSSTAKNLSLVLRHHPYSEISDIQMAFIGLSCAGT